MANQFNFKHPKYLLYIAYAVYAIVFWCLASNYLYAIGPDYIGYVGIAKHYTEGSFMKAINTWWSPLYSWLLAICIKCGINDLWANKIIQFLVGLYLLKNVSNILAVYIPKIKANILSLAFIPFLLYWALISDTPDFLAAALLVHFFHLVLAKKENYVQLGIIGALAYLAKSFNIYFLTTFSICYILYLLIVKEKINWNIVIKTVATFFVIIFSWVIAMQVKSKQWMLTSRAEADLCIIHHPNIEPQNIQLYDCGGLYFDTNSYYSNWEQPYLYNTISYGKVYNTISIISKKFAKSTFNFAKSYISIYQLIGILVAFVVFFREKWKLVVPFFLFYFIYLAGHFVFHQEPRFFIMPQILFALLFVIGMYKFFQKYLSKQIQLFILLVFILLGKSPIQQLFQYKYYGKVMQIKNLAESNRNISNSLIAAELGLFEEALYLSYFSNSKCIGTLPADHSNDFLLLQWKEKLRRKITYLEIVDGKLLLLVK